MATITAFPITTEPINTDGVRVKGTGETTDKIRIDDGGIDDAALADMPDTTIKGNVSGGAAAPSNLTGTQVNTMLPVATVTDKGLMPALPNDNQLFLDGTGNWTAVASGTAYTTVTVNGARITYRTLSGTPVITFDTTTATAPVLSVSGGTIRLKEVRHTVNPNPATSTNYTYTFNATWADALDSMPTTVTKYKVPSYQIDLDNTPGVLCPGGTTSQITVDFWAVSEQMIFSFSWNNTE